MFELLMEPLAVTSWRKLVAVAAVPLCALVWLMSEELTEPFALVSPMSTPIVAETLPVLVWESSTVFKVTVTYWALDTPVRFTVYLFGFGPIELLLTLPALVLTLPTLVMLR